MILPEVKVADLLTADQKLVAMMAELRSMPLDFTPIYTYTPDDSLVKAEAAPWIRVTPIPGDRSLASDDERAFEYPRVQVDFWLREENMDRLVEIQEQIYQTLKVGGFYRYYQDRYTDPDLDGCLMVTANFEGFLKRKD